MGADGRPEAERPEPAHKLTVEERERVMAVCHEPRFADLPPSQIVPRLADEGKYLASEGGPGTVSQVAWAIAVGD